MPPSEDAPLLRAIRDAMSLADRMELALADSGGGPDEEIWRDLGFAGLADPDSLELLADLVDRLGAERAVDVAGLAACRALLARYRAGEFAPPEDWYSRDLEPPAP